MKEILLATKNDGKIKEFKKLLEKFNVEVLSLRDFSIEEPEETGKTFEENSVLKVRYYAENLKISALADDSGFCVNALNNFPAIYSSRLNGTNTNYLNTFNVLELLLKYNNISDYSAHFCCSISFYDFTTKKVNSFEGKIEGKLDFSIKGTNGFGYDPIFIPNGYDKTFAEMDMDEKNKISHRALAFDKFIKWFGDNYVEK